MSRPILTERQRLSAYRAARGATRTDPAVPSTQPRRVWRDPFIAAIVAVGATLILSAALVAAGLDFSGFLHDLRALSAWFPR